jgi:hypothetical protein
MLREILLTADGSKRKARLTKLLSSLLRCESCGGAMYAGLNTRRDPKTGQRRGVYKCQTNAHGGNCRTAMVIAAAAIDEYVTQRYLDTFGDAERTVMCGSPTSGPLGSRS